MTIEKLKRFPQETEPPKTTPRCEASVSVMTEHERRWRQDRYDNNGNPFQCSRSSVVRLGGRHYCRLHGGHVALDMAISGELVECKKPPEKKCAICGGKHDNDLLTDICKACEARIDEEGSP